VRWKRGEPGLQQARPERLSVIEHEAVIQPPSEAVHHKPVFKSLHDIIITHKITEKFRKITTTHLIIGAKEAAFMLNALIISDLQKV